MRIPRNHPRYESLRIRELLVNGLKKGLVVPEGLLAHGRGEAFDYLLGERSIGTSVNAARAAAALLLTAENPVISVNGNAAALVPGEVLKLASVVNAGVEVNLFHRSLNRERRIEELLRRKGARHVLGVGRDASARVQGVSSRRRNVDPAGIGLADLVLVPLEDGDRAKALLDAGKRVIAIDLNPLSRTSRVATVTIVDNIVRALPLLIDMARRLRTRDARYLGKIVSDFDNRRNLSLALQEMIEYLENLRFQS